MSLESAIKALADEFKRYNDANACQVVLSGTASALVPAAVSSMREDKELAPKPETKKASPKAAPAPEAVVITLADVQTQAVAFVAARNRDELIDILKKSGVQPEEVNGKPIYKLSNAKDQPKVLAKISDSLKAALEAAA